MCDGSSSNARSGNEFRLDNTIFSALGGVYAIKCMDCAKYTILRARN